MERWLRACYPTTMFQATGGTVILFIKNVCKSYPTQLAVVIMLLGALERYFWLYTHRDQPFNTAEAFNVALSVARNGTVANVFGRGSGLSTHFTPILPIFAGTIYRLFGIKSYLSESILATVSISLVMGTGYFLFLALEKLSVPALWRLIALALFSLFPMFFDLEAVSFRIWEGGLAAFLGAWVLFRILQADQWKTQSMGRWCATSCIVAVLFFLNPPSGLACFGLLGVWLLRHRPVKKWPKYIISTTLILLAVLTPWTIRNYEAFGKFIPLRSNFGLEIALANHSAAVSGENQKQVFWARLTEIHPFSSPAAFAQMQHMGGERIYSDWLGRQTKSWIAHHPADFVR